MNITSIKKYVVLVISMGMLLVIGSFLYDYYDKQEIVEDEKIVEILESQIMGYENGKLNWQVTVNDAWAKKNRSMYYADSILSGVIYDSDGDVIIDSIEASKIKINTKINSITVTNGAKARFLHQEKTEETGLIAADKDPDKNPIIIKSDELRYYSNSERVYLKKGVELIKDSHTIKPIVGAEIDNETKVAYIDNGFHIESEEFFVSGNKMVIYIDDKYSILSGSLRFEQFASKNIDENLDEQEKSLREQNSVLYADEGEFYESDEGDQLYVTGNVKLTQADKDIAAYSANYNQSNDTMQLYKDVSISLQNLDWAIDKDLKRDLSNEDIKNSLNQETTITCDKLLFDGQKKETVLLGNIKIIQSDKIIYCDRLKLYDETSIVECFGNVKVIKDKKDNIKTDYLVIDLNKETFTAKHGVYSEYHLDEN